MMAALQNDWTEIQLSAVVDGQFDMLKVSHVITETDSIFRKIQQELNLKDYERIRQSHLNERHVSKENLAEWLETVCNILDSFSVPLLKNAMSTFETTSKRIDEFQREKIDDQRKIIQLGDEVLDKRSEELNDVKSTVLTGMKSSSLIAKKSCPTTITRKTIEAAVKSVCDKEDRSKNVIIYGMKESSDEVLCDEIGKILEEIDERPIVRDCV